MFEQKLEEMKASIFFTEKEVSMLDVNGVATFKRGFNDLDYYQAVELVNKMKRLSVNIKAKELKKFNVILKTICFAFGYEFCEKYLYEPDTAKDGLAGERK